VTGERAAAADPGAAGRTGVEGNGRLTAVNGMVLLVLLAAEGVTILGIRQLITWHVYIGLLLVGPVVLKSASTGWRFVRYYGRSRPYVEKGPPHPILRVLGPIVMISTFAVLGTGIGLIFTGPDRREPLLTLHQASFIVWIGATGIHVLGHILHASTTTWRELRDPRATPATRQRRWRTVAIAAALIVGVGLATALTPAAHAWTSLQYQRDEHHDRSAAGLQLTTAAVPPGWPVGKPDTRDQRPRPIRSLDAGASSLAAAGSELSKPFRQRRKK